jgi:hypothetical protein
MDSALWYFSEFSFMSYVPGFRYDLFVSYASEDNVDGWVEKFETQLTGELSRLLGRPFSSKAVFLDKSRLRVGQAYPEELDESARDSAFLVVLLSPSYATSDWCARERHMFQDRLPQGATLAECVAAVRVRPIEGLPASLSDAQRIDFVVPGFHEPWPAASGKWIEGVNRLAAEMKDALQALRRRAGAVFVGKPLSSRMDLRGNLVDYLSEQHFRSIPEPAALLDDRAASQKALTEGVCAVHFIGGAIESTLETIEDSTIYCSGPTILFHPFGVPLSAAEELVLDGLASGRQPHRIDSNEIELRRFLEDLLTRTRTSLAPKPASLGIICDPSDFPWARSFRPDGLSVDHPAFLDEKITNTDRLRRWLAMVRESHGLLFYHGRSEESLLEKIRKIAEQENSPAARRWYLADPNLEEKRVRHPADPSYPDGLEDFLNEVRRRARAAAKP